MVRGIPTVDREDKMDARTWIETVLRQMKRRRKLLMMYGYNPLYRQYELAKLATKELERLWSVLA
jgi:hypothetical protein